MPNFFFAFAIVAGLCTLGVFLPYAARVLATLVLSGHLFRMQRNLRDASMTRCFVIAGEPSSKESGLSKRRWNSSLPENDSSSSRSLKELFLIWLWSGYIA